MTVVTVPGYENSGPEHWQSLWEAANPSFVRVEQADWFAPRREAWVKTLEATVAAQPGPVVLVAHSLGCATVAHWAAARTGVPVRAALLVAPADVDNAGVEELASFAPMPLTPLPFPSVVVASSDDPWVTVERSRQFAEAWGARFVEVGAHGHLNSASGIGHWPEGFELLTELLGS